MTPIYYLSRTAICDLIYLLIFMIDGVLGFWGFGVGDGRGSDSLGPQLALGLDLIHLDAAIHFHVTMDP